MPKPNKKSRRKPPEDELEEEEEHCPHIPLMSMEDKETTKLRFAVGTEVACNTGEDWPEGRVTKQFYTQRSFPPGYCTAYQVEMHDGRLIFAPRDNDHFIGVPAAAKEAEWDAFFSEAVAAGHMSSSEIDSLSDALAELSSAGERRELIDEQIEQAHARALLLWVPAVLAVRVLSMAGARGVVRIAQTCKALRGVAESPEVWECLLERRHALVGAVNVGDDVPQGPTPEHKKPPYYEPTNEGVLAAWQRRLSALRADGSSSQSQQVAGSSRKTRGSSARDAARMGPKALFVSMHTTARGRVISKHCAELTCNMMYKGRLTPRGSIDICANAVIPDPNRPRHPFGWGRDCGPGLACGVHGCAAAPEQFATGSCSDDMFARSSEAPHSHR